MSKPICTGGKRKTNVHVPANWPSNRSCIIYKWNGSKFDDSEEAHQGGIADPDGSALLDTTKELYYNEKNKS